MLSPGYPEVANLMGSMLSIAGNRHGILIHALCIMSNHVHADCAGPTGPTARANCGLRELRLSCLRAPAEGRSSAGRTGMKPYAIMLLVLLLQPGCADETDGWICGNGYCEAGENGTSCPADCSAYTSCGNDVCDFDESLDTCPADCGYWAGCSSHAECAADEFCYNRGCEMALGRKYRVTIVSGGTATSKPNGEDWDVGGGAPDLFVSFGIEGGERCSTSVANNSFSAAWNESCEFVIDAGDAFTVWLIDEDLYDDDVAVWWKWEGIDDLVNLIWSNGSNYTLAASDMPLETVTLRVTPTF